MFNEKSLKETLSKNFEKVLDVRLIKAGVFQIFLPYFHEDGDMIDIFVKSFGNKILITDFGKTMMRLSYYTNLDSPTKQKLLKSILASYFVNYEGGKLTILVENISDLFAYIMEFISVVTKVSDISFLKQERVRSLFYEHFDDFMIKGLPKDLDIKIKKDYFPSFDKKKEYVSPYAILKKNTPPILFFPVLNDDRCKDVTMTLLYYKTKGFDNKAIVIFNDFNDVQNTNSGKLIDIADRPLTNFDNNKEKMVEYVSELI